MAKLILDRSWTFVSDTKALATVKVSSIVQAQSWGGKWGVGKYRTVGIYQSTTLMHCGYSWKDASIIKSEMGVWIWIWIWRDLKGEDILAMVLDLVSLTIGLAVETSLARMLMPLTFLPRAAMTRAAIPASWDSGNQQKASGCVWKGRTDLWGWHWCSTQWSLCVGLDWVHVLKEGCKESRTHIRAIDDWIGGLWAVQKTSTYATLSSESCKKFKPT